MSDPTNQPEPTFGYEKDVAPEPYNPQYGAPQQPVQPPQPQYNPYGQQPVQQPPVAPQPYPQPQYGQLQQPTQQPYGQPQYQQPYPQQPYVQQQPTFAQQQYQPVNPANFAPPPKKSKAGVIIAIIIAAFFVLGTPIWFFFTLFMASISGDGNTDTGTSNGAPYDPSTSPYVPDTSFDDDEYIDSSGGGGSGLEDRWISGAIWKTPPAAMTPPTAFSSDYYDVNEWLDTVPGVDPEMTVITTSDPAYNCSGTASTGSFGGCYVLSYGKTLFVWWSADATDDQKKFMVLHEYSHYEQAVRYFDAQLSAIDQGFASNETLLSTMEADATCRVFYSYGYAQYEYLNDQISAPCTPGTSWYEGYWEDQIVALGVIIEDY